VVFTGNIIDELHNKMTELEASIAALQMMADQLRKQLEEKSSNDKVSALEAYMADMRPGWKA
jgi:predicted ATP-grasp superfamily ATP-dependent carboligase